MALPAPLMLRYMLELDNLKQCCFKSLNMLIGT